MAPPAISPTHTRAVGTTPPWTGPRQPRPSPPQASACDEPACPRRARARRLGAGIRRFAAHGPRAGAHDRPMPAVQIVAATRAGEVVVRWARRGVGPSRRQCVLAALAVEPRVGSARRRACWRAWFPLALLFGWVTRRRDCGALGGSRARCAGRRARRCCPGALRGAWRLSIDRRPPSEVLGTQSTSAVVEAMEGFVSCGRRRGRARRGRGGAVPKRARRGGPRRCNSLVLRRAPAPRRRAPLLAAARTWPPPLSGSAEPELPLACVEGTLTRTLPLPPRLPPGEDGRPGCCTAISSTSGLLPRRRARAAGRLVDGSCSARASRRRALRRAPRGIARFSLAYAGARAIR